MFEIFLRLRRAKCYQFAKFRGRRVVGIGLRQPPMGRIWRPLSSSHPATRNHETSSLFFLNLRPATNTRRAQARLSTNRHIPSFNDEPPSNPHRRDLSTSRQSSRQSYLLTCKYYPPTLPHCHLEDCTFQSPYSKKLGRRLSHSPERTRKTMY